MSVPYLIPVLAIVIGTIVFSRWRRRKPQSPPRTLPSEALTENHDWRGGRVEIVVEPQDGHWIGHVRFRGEDLTWEESGPTAREAHRKAFEFFLQVCPDHECGPRCGPPTGTPRTAAQ